MGYIYNSHLDEVILLTIQSCPEKEVTTEYITQKLKETRPATTKNYVNTIAIKLATKNLVDMKNSKLDGNFIYSLTDLGVKILRDNEAERRNAKVFKVTK